MPDTHYTEWFRFSSQALPEDTFHVIRFSGTEGLNRLFSFTIDLASRNTALDTETLLNTPAAFTILREGGAEPAVFRGYPARVEQGGHFGGFAFYTVELRPAFWKLTQIAQSAVFLNKTARETADALLNSQRFFRFPHEFRLVRQYPAPEFAMQYEESLFDYILFRMEEQGAYFYFAPDGDRVVFADGPQSHDRTSVTLSYAPPSGLDHTRRAEILHTFTLSHTPLPRQVVVRCYDWKNPNRVIVGKAEVTPTGLGDVYLAGENAESQAEADRLARIRAEERLCKSRVFHGAGSVPGLRPGVVFTLADHYSPAFNREYLVTDITHEGTQETYISLGLGIPLRPGEAGGTGAPDHYFYRNGFSCIPSDLPFRPPRTAPRAKIAGVLHAFVDGAANKRAERDEYGRYKLVFPFDVSGRKGGNASCWIRMAGPQSGRDSGLAFPLLPGTEVVVSFVDGNPDRPVITGSLANGETGSISGRGNANMSGIRSAGGNQLTINDTDKQQGVALTTASGLGYSMSSGSLGHTGETADTVLKAASVGGAEVASAFKDVATGFKISHTVYDDPAWYGWLSTLTSALAGGGAAVLDSLSGKTGKGGEAVKWVSTGLKTLVPVTDLVDKVMTKIDDGRSTYGVTLSAGADMAKSSVQVRPSTAKLVGVVLAWIVARGVVYGADVAAGGGDIADNTEAQAREEYEESMDAAVKTLHDDPDHAETSYDYAGDTGDRRKYANVSHDLDELIEKQRLAGADVKELEKKKKKLDDAWSKYRDDGSDDYYKKAKQQAIRDIVTSTANDLVPEIAALIALIISRVNLAKQLGGVSIVSKDNNVNIRGKEPVSVHSETGILLDTSQSFGDAGKWGIPSLTGARQDLGKLWPDDTDVPRPPAAGKYVVLNATNGTLGRFSLESQSVTARQWVSESPLHILKSGRGDAPNARLRILDGDEGVMEAKVSASGKILLNRGEAKPKLELSGDGGILANGANVQLALTEAQAEMKAQGSGLTLKKNETELKGDNASVLCKRNVIVVNPTNAGKSVVSGITFQRSQLKADGVMELKSGMIKIG